MPWTTRDIPEQSGRVAVVTGANAGLGLETARALAAAGAHVLMCARSAEKVIAAERDIRASVPKASLRAVPLDLASLDSVREAAKHILHHDRIDILVNNAGVMAIPRQSTEDGFEMQFGVNHLGHYALTSLLMPALLRAEAARVVTVTSTAHHMGRAVDPSDVHLERGYGEWQAYGRSKLANYHFALGLQRRFEKAGAGAASLLAHPGLSDTNLQTASVEATDGGATQRFFLGLARRTGMTAADGALPQLRAATDPSARGGEFYAPRFVNFGPAVRVPVLRRVGMSQAIETLFQVSARETGIVLETKSA